RSRSCVASRSQKRCPTIPLPTTTTVRASARAAATSIVSSALAANAVIAGLPRHHACLWSRLPRSRGTVRVQGRCRDAAEARVPLLVRTGRSTRPTPAGEVLLQCARQVLDKIEEVQRVLGEHGNGKAGVIRIGTPEPASNYLLPPVLAELKRRLPKVDVRVISG